MIGVCVRYNGCITKFNLKDIVEVTEVQRNWLDSKDVIAEDPSEATIGQKQIKEQVNEGAKPRNKCNHFNIWLRNNETDNTGAIIDEKGSGGRWAKQDEATRGVEICSQ